MKDTACTVLAAILLSAGVAGCDGGAPTGSAYRVPPQGPPVSPPLSPGRPAPTVVEITPAAGPTKGGTTVRLSGSGFSTSSTVTLDELVVPSTVLVSGLDTTLSFITPPHFAVPMVVRVRNDDGQVTRETYVTYTYLTPFSPVTNGRWLGFDDGHNVLLFNFEDGTLTRVECHVGGSNGPASRHVFSPALVVQDGEFAFTGSDGFSITGLVTSATKAVGTANLPPCTAGDWDARYAPQ